MSFRRSKTPSKFLPLLLVLFLAATVSAQPPGYDLQVESATFEPGDVVHVYIKGPLANLSFSVRLTDSQGDIVAGRDVQLNSTGGYDFAWTPSSEGQFNATVVFSTGVSITKKFLIQDKVTSGDIGELYRSLFALEQRILARLAALEQLVTVVTGLAVVSIAIAVGLGIYTRKNISRPELEFEKFLKSSVESDVRKLASEVVKLRKR